MSKILFYHHTESSCENTLPILINKSLQRGWRVVVQFMSEEQRDYWDMFLWTWSQSSFIPHGTEHDRWPEEQPVLLTIGYDNLNKANVCFCMEGRHCKLPLEYQRVVFSFDEQNLEQLNNARQEWSKLKKEGHNLTYYWQQTSGKGWEKRSFC